MYLSDLQTKDIVSMKDGSNLGKIIDAKIDDNGNILEIVAQDKKIWRKMSEYGEMRFPFSSIKKIGSDVILIDV